MNSRLPVMNVATFDELLVYLNEELDWPISADNFGDAVYEYDTNELGLDEASARTIDRICQLRPLSARQPWAVFFVQFGANRHSVTALRRILRGLVTGNRTAIPGMPAFRRENILFVCLHSENHFVVAHFKGVPERPGQSVISAFGWSPDSPARTLFEFNLPCLSWPEDTQDSEAWHNDWVAAFDKEKVTNAFYAKYLEVFQHVEESFRGFGREKDCRRIFTQRLFSRLMFIAFIQKKGWLSINGNVDYLNSLWNDFKANEGSDGNFYNDRLKPLFFKGLNSLDKSERTKRLIGDVPFLNGGLFEKHPDDGRPEISIPNDCFSKIFFQLFARFNFTVTESTPLDIEVAVDPEILGKTFERLVIWRNEKGSYYTPKSIVQFMCREALKNHLGGHAALIDRDDVNHISVPDAKRLLAILDKIRICDPACGSGAYLVGMLDEIHRLMVTLDTRAGEVSARDDYARKLAIIQNSLYGVDIDEFATNIAKLRLWLALAVEHRGGVPEPLPNLDFKIETGDSLTAPDPQLAGANMLRAIVIEEYQLKKEEYIREQGPERKAALRSEISAIRTDLAVMVHEGVTVSGFDWAVEFAEVFHDGGFDVVIANPPYGVNVTDALRFRYFPRADYSESQSKDTYGIFMARGLQLLRPGGFFTYIVSDTWRTIRTFKPLRQKLLENTTVQHVIDVPEWVFDAVVNTCIVSLRKTPADAEHNLIACDLRGLRDKDWQSLESNLLAIAAHGPDVQTLNVARYTYPQSLISSYGNLSFFIGSPRLYRLMSDERFVPLGDVADVKQGLATADNKYYLRKEPGAHGGYELIDRSLILTDDEIAGLSDAEKQNGVIPRDYGGRHFVPYDKGGASDAGEGWLPNYWVPTQYYIDWSRESVNRLRTLTVADRKRHYHEDDDINEGDEDRIASRFQNEQYYFRPGLTFSITGVYSPSFRYSGLGVFDVKGSRFVPHDIDSRILLSFCCSLAFRYIAKSFVYHALDLQVDALKACIIPSDVSHNASSRLISKVEATVEKQKVNQSYPYHLHEQREIDSLVYQLYGLSDDDIREIEIWFCRRYPRLAEAQGKTAEAREKYADFLEGCREIMAQSAT